MGKHFFDTEATEHKVAGYLWCLPWTKELEDQSQRREIYQCLLEGAHAVHPLIPVPVEDEITVHLSLANSFTMYSMYAIPFAVGWTGGGVYRAVDYLLSLGDIKEWKKKSRRKIL